MGRRTEAAAARVAAMAKAYAAGRTLQSIGDEYGLTHERVRQLIKPTGVTRQTGGIHVQAARRAESRQAKLTAARDFRAIAAYGCTAAELDEIAPWGVRAKRDCPVRAYRVHKRNSSARGIAFEFTLPEWWEIWQASGRWAERGRTRDAAVMARHGDSGPYAAWNVYITTLASNASDYQAALKKRGILCFDGYKRLRGNPKIATIGPAPQPINPEDEAAQLQREFVSAVKALEVLQRRMSHNGMQVAA